MDTVRRSSQRYRLLDRPMVNLCDSIGGPSGVTFSLWLPAGARRSEWSTSDVAFLLDADGDTLELVIELARGTEVRSLVHQVAFWKGLGDEIHRAAQLVDGYLVTSVGNVDLNVVRQLRVGERALQCWAQVRRRTESLATRIVWAESICSSLVANAPR